ncbi:hypothetical protein ILUMI_12698 [Ignelater luminosus]|uniref:C2H2-type domain-containing protein n=1 Tax=Ignelater luminosus TaxID=2038154 RepID=A0A8K0CTQ5_IGNLU|nr:hypothetical protein ILUMI_12698 [Ignelater luminosus]
MVSSDPFVTSLRPPPQRIYNKFYLEVHQLLAPPESQKESSEEPATTSSEDSSTDIQSDYDSTSSSTSAGHLKETPALETALISKVSEFTTHTDTSAPPPESTSTSEIPSESTFFAHVADDPALWPQIISDKLRLFLTEHEPKHLSRTLKRHEKSSGHLFSVKEYVDLKNDLLEGRRRLWTAVLKRIIEIMTFLARQNLVLRGTTERLYESNNGNFLKLVECISNFDNTLSEHISRIQSAQHRMPHYLGHNIKNELINIISEKIKTIVDLLKQSKYYSIILNCRPDISHKEQLTVIVRFFAGYRYDWTYSLDFLKSINIELGDLRGQGYDNGANMRGKNIRLQKKNLDMNPRAFYVPCAPTALIYHVRVKGCTAVDPEAVHKCLYCDRPFKTFAGLRQHERLEHQEQYNAELEAETQTADNVKYQRSLPSYKLQIEIIRTEREEAGSDVEPEPNMDSPITSPQPGTSINRSPEIFSHNLSIENNNSSFVPILNDIVITPPRSEQDSEVSSFNTFLRECLIKEELTLEDKDLVKLIMIQSEVASERLDRLADDLILCCVPRQGPTSRKKPPYITDRTGNNKYKGRAAERAFAYKRMQNLYYKDKGRLANTIIDHLDSTSTDFPSVESISNTYSNLFGPTENIDDAPVMIKQEVGEVSPSTQKMHRVIRSGGAEKEDFHPKSTFQISGELIKQVNTSDHFSYLGNTYGFAGVFKQNCEYIKTSLSNIHQSPLKPHQKLVVIRQYLMPRLIPHFQILNIDRKLLIYADKLIRQAVKRIAHCPVTIPNAFIHAPLREGGLGICSLLDSVPAILLQRLNNLAAIRNHSAIESTFGSRWGQALLERVERLFLRNGHTTKEVRAYWARNLQNSTSGNGLKQGSDFQYSSLWISDPPKYWSGRDYVKALQLRANVLPTVGTPYNKGEAARCRAGCDRTESLSHVLQGCPSTHWPRIRRHDHIVNIVADAARNKGWTVETEPNIWDTDGNRKKPDLLIKKNNNIIITDIAIYWEGPRSLQLAADTKLNYYSSPPFIEALRRRHPNSTISPPCPTAPLPRPGVAPGYNGHNTPGPPPAPLYLQPGSSFGPHHVISNLTTCNEKTPSSHLPH